MSTAPTLHTTPQTRSASPAQPVAGAAQRSRRRTRNDAAADTESVELGANTVSLIGRLAAPAEARKLPSGDTVLVWRLIVPRAKPRPTGTTLDTIDCASFDARIIKRGTSWAEGCWLEADGALRRRFWRSPGGPRSRYEVEVSAAKVVAKPAVGKPAPAG